MKAYHGRLRRTKTSGQNWAGAERSSRGGRRRGSRVSSRLPKKTRGREGRSTRNRGTARSCGISRAGGTADISLYLSILDAKLRSRKAGRTLRRSATRTSCQGFARQTVYNHGLGTLPQFSL